MALINGNDYDHIDFTKNGVTTRHMLKDTLSRQMSGDLVKVQNEEPTSEGTKIWIKPSGDSEVQVPTYEEFEELSDKIDDVDATIESLAVGAQPTVSVTEVNGHKRFSFGIPASNGIASITKTATDGVIDTYTIAMTDGTSTSFSVNNSDISPESMAEAIATALQDYARIDGYYPDLTAGNADQLNSTKFVENKEPYLYRPSGGTSDIGNRKYLDAIVGVSLPWNQMVRDEASENQTNFADILTVTDAVEDAAGVKVKIEPVQDLHGYDHPWPAGGGKNLMPPPTSVEANGTDLRVTHNNGQLTINGNIHSGDTIIARIEPITISEGHILAFLNSFVNSTVYFLNGTTNVDYFSANTTNRVVNTSSMATLYGKTFNAYRIMFSSDQTLTNASFALMEVADGADTTKFSPYSNICPITGWNQAKVTRMGKNLFDQSQLLQATGWVLNNDGYYYGIRSAFNIAFGGGFPVNPKFKPNTQYTLSFVGYNNQAISNTYFYINYTDGTRSIVAFGSAIPTKYTLTSTAGKTIAYVSGTFGSEGTIIAYIKDVMIEEGVSASDYKLYTSQTYSITLPTEAGTVYGGELTINADGSGSLVVDRLGKTYTGASDEGWTMSGVGTYVKVEVLKKSGSVPLSNQYLMETGTGTAFNIRPIGNNNFANKNEWLAYLAENPLQVVFELETPLTYSLTASEVTTLLGINNIWSDTGDVALTYTGTDEHLVLESGKKYLARINGTDSMLLGSGQEITSAKGTDNVFDLTKMFGTSVADYVYNQGAEYFRQWFRKTWYSYNTGELKHVEGLESHDVVGFNLFDGTVEFGNVNNNGQPDGNTRTYIRTSDYTRVLPNTSYCFHAENAREFSQLYTLEFDENKTLINRVSRIGSNSSIKTATVTFTTEANAAYVKMFIYHNIVFPDFAHCLFNLNLAHNGSRNGEYEPYEKYSHPLDNTVILRGIPKVGSNGVYWDGDRYLPDGTVEKRYGVIVFNGAENWIQTSASVNAFYATIARSQMPYKYRGEIAVLAEYPFKGYSASAYSNTIGAQNGSCAYAPPTSDIGNVSEIAFKDLLCNTVDAWKSKLASNPVTVIYELAEPTYEQATPYRNFQLVDDWGTEEFVTTGMIPVGHESRYPANLRDKLQHLPDAANSNGSYLITQTDGQMTLTPFPAPPTTAGKYVLRATVTNGVATFTWEATT